MRDATRVPTLTCVDIREIDRDDEVLVRRHWEIGKLADAVRPYDFYPPWETAWKSYQTGRDDIEMNLLGAFDGDLMVGAARADVPVLDNLHTAYTFVSVDPSHQRRGVGRALDGAVVDKARSLGRRLVMTEAFAPPESDSPGLLFARAMGYATGLQDGMKVVDLFETEASWDALDASTLEHRDGYRIVLWRDHVPAELVDGYCVLNEAFFNEAPIGEMEHEPEKWDAKRVQEREERNAKTGRHDVSAGALAPDGTLVAMTEVMVNAAAPWRGFQSGTLVAREHRGHRLGLAIKVANHRQLREAWPDVRILVTGNADVNAPMNAVNEALGYREIERCVEMQKDV